MFLKNVWIFKSALQSKSSKVKPEVRPDVNNLFSVISRRLKQSLFDSDLIDWDILKPGTSGLQKQSRSANTSSNTSVHVTDSDYGLTDTSSSEEDKNLRRTTLYRINK